MKVGRGDTVKVADIGIPGFVIKVGASSRAIVVEFDFPEGKVQSTLPVSIISFVLSREKSYVSA